MLSAPIHQIVAHQAQVYHFLTHLLAAASATFLLAGFLFRKTRLKSLWSFVKSGFRFHHDFSPVRLFLTLLLLAAIVVLIIAAVNGSGILLGCSGGVLLYTLCDLMVTTSYY